MKIFIRNLLLLVTLILVASCEIDNETVNDADEIFETIQPGVLKSINVERIGCSISSSIINFEDNEITDVQYTTGNKSEYFYINGLLSERLEYHSNTILLFTYTYQYDNEGRIIEIVRTLNSDNPIINDNRAQREESQFTYHQDYIAQNDLWYYADGSLNDLQGPTQYYYFNSEQLIVKYKIYDWEEDFVFIDGNPSSYNGLDASMNLTHFDGVEMDGYHIEEYMFGTHWKNNSKLAQFLLFEGMSSLLFLGDDLLRSYTYFDENLTIINTLNVEYEVDVEGRLEKQFKEFTNAAGGHYYENVTYLFED